MKLNIYKKSSLMRNMLIFLMSSFFYLLLIYSIKNNLPALSKTTALSLLKEWPHIMFFYCLSFFSIYKVWTSSRYIFLILLSLFSFEGIQVFLVDFDKTILILNFVFISVSFCFFILWWSDLKGAVYRPGFSIYDLGRKSEYDLEVSVEDKEGNTFIGYLTNWDDVSCFVYFEGDEVPTKGNILLKIKSHGRIFEHEAEIMSRYEKGFGLKFRTSNSDLNWNDFYKIICDRGYYPRSESRA